MKGWMQKRGIIMCKLKGWMDKDGHYDLQINGWMEKGAISFKNFKTENG